MKILLLNGPNLNMLGVREPEKYGNLNLESIENSIIELGRKNNVEIECFQSNHEGEIIDKIQTINPEKIYIIGLSNLSLKQKEYFKTFYNQLSDKDVVITFSYNPHKKNVFAINIGNDYAILYAVLHKIFEYIPITSEKLSFFLTKCEVNSLSNIINLKNNGAKNIYLSDCPPIVINPAVLRAFIKMFDIKQL